MLHSPPNLTHPKSAPHIAKGLHDRIRPQHLQEKVHPHPKKSGRMRKPMQLIVFSQLTIMDSFPTSTDSINHARPQPFLAPSPRNFGFALVRHQVNSCIEVPGKSPQVALFEPSTSLHVSHTIWTRMKTAHVTLCGDKLAVPLSFKLLAVAFRGLSQCQENLQVGIAPPGFTKGTRDRWRQTCLCVSQHLRAGQVSYIQVPDLGKLFRTTDMSNSVFSVQKLEVER